MKRKRHDPYRSYRFHVKWDGRTVAAFKKVSGLGDPVGSEAQAAKGPRDWTAFEAITLEQGVTQDREFEQWAHQIWDFGLSRSGVSLNELRREVTIEQRNEAGQVVMGAQVFRCWVSEFQTLPELDSSAKVLAIQTMKLENEGWE